MRVFIADRNLEGAEATAKELNAGSNGKAAWAVQVDVVDWDSQAAGFEAAVKELGRIDYVFAVAGIPELSWLPNRPKATTFEKPNLAVFNVNANGVLLTSSLAIQQFRRQEPNKYGFRGKSKFTPTHLWSSREPLCVNIQISSCGSGVWMQLLLYSASSNLYRCKAVSYFPGIWVEI
jgi:NAD(P)-dependent dehydrogenase (short-subunit alcohol dehydrogenase family)